MCPKVIVQWTHVHFSMDTTEKEVWKACMIVNDGFHRRGDLFAPVETSFQSKMKRSVSWSYLLTEYTRCKLNMKVMLQNLFLCSIWTEFYNTNEYLEYFLFHFLIEDISARCVHDDDVVQHASSACRHSFMPKIWQKCLCIIATYTLGCEIST